MRAHVERSARPGPSGLPEPGRENNGKCVQVGGFLCLPPVPGEVTSNVCAKFFSDASCEAIEAWTEFAQARSGFGTFMPDQTVKVLIPL